jgi:hypothetical protein
LTALRLLNPLQPFAARNKGKLARRLLARRLLKKIIANGTSPLLSWPARGEASPILAAASWMRNMRPAAARNLAKRRATGAVPQGESCSRPLFKVAHDDMKNLSDLNIPDANAANLTTPA